MSIYTAWLFPPLSSSVRSVVLASRTCRSHSSHLCFKTDIYERGMTWPATSQPDNLIPTRATLPPECEFKGMIDGTSAAIFDLKVDVESVQ
jgi:hypothetical protein